MKPFTLTAIAASVLATVTYPSVQAQETPSNSETVVTAPVVVTATRTEKKTQRSSVLFSRYHRRSAGAG